MQTRDISQVLALQFVKQFRLQQAFADLAHSQDLQDFINL